MRSVVIYYWFRRWPQVKPRQSTGINLPDLTEPDSDITVCLAPVVEPTGLWSWHYLIFTPSAKLKLG